MARKIMHINLDNDVAEVYHHGEDDFEIYYQTADYSLRGTANEVYADLMEHKEVK